MINSDKKLDMRRKTAHLSKSNEINSYFSEFIITEFDRNKLINRKNFDREKLSAASFLSKSESKSSKQ